MVLARLLEIRSVAIGLATLALSLAFLSPKPSEAAVLKDFFRYQVSNPECSIRARWQGKWVAFKPKLEKGTLAVGKPAPKNPDIVLFKTKKYRKIILAARKSCLFGSGMENVRVDERIKWQANLSVISWQEGLHLNGGSNDVKERATNIGLCPGATWLNVNERTEWGISGCILYAKSQVGAASADSDVSSTGGYRAKSADVFGVMGSYDWYWRPLSQNVAIGVNLPLIIRYGVWPIIEESDTTRIGVGPSFFFLVGVFLESRLERGSWHFSQKVGFLNIPNSLSWALEGGYTF